MLKTTLNNDEAIAIFQPDGVLTKEDFTEAAQSIDSFLEQHEKLNGLIIYTESFPGWDSFASLVAHLKFIKNHHKKLTHLAFFTDSRVGDFAEKIGSHFVAAEVKTFPFDQLGEAKLWIIDN